MCLKYKTKESSLLIIVYHKTHTQQTNSQDKKEDITRTINNWDIKRNFFCSSNKTFRLVDTKHLVTGFTIIHEKKSI